MSRSYKKYPLVRQERENLKYLNRKIRRDKFAEIPNGGGFKKHSPHWNNWNYRWSIEQAIETYYKREYFQKKYPTLEEYLIWYKKTVLSK